MPGKQARQQRGGADHNAAPRGPHMGPAGSLHQAPSQQGPPLPLCWPWASPHAAQTPPSWHPPPGLEPPSARTVLEHDPVIEQAAFCLKLRRSSEAQDWLEFAILRLRGLGCQAQRLGSLRAKLTRLNQYGGHEA